MEMSNFERWMTNSAPRRFFQKWWEFPAYRRIMKRHGSDIRGGIAIDIGCGRGDSSRLLHNVFHPRQVLAFDIFPATTAWNELQGEGIYFSVASATALPVPEESVDLVFGFGIFHHIQDRQAALEEIHAVLRPGGILLVGGEPILIPEVFSLGVFQEELSTCFNIMEKYGLYTRGFPAYLCKKSDS